MNNIEHEFSPRQLGMLQKFLKEFNEPIDPNLFILKFNEWIGKDEAHNKERSNEPKRDTRKFIDVVNKFYDENNSIRSSISRFKEAVVTFFKTEYGAKAYRPYFDNEKHNKELEKVNLITMQDLYDAEERVGIEGLLEQEKIGKKTKKYFSKFLEETKI